MSAARSVVIDISRTGANLLARFSALTARAQFPAEMPKSAGCAAKPGLSDSVTVSKSLAADLLSADALALASTRSITSYDGRHRGPAARLKLVGSQQGTSYPGGDYRSRACSGLANLSIGTGSRRRMTGSPLRLLTLRPRHSRVELIDKRSGDPRSRQIDANFLPRIIVRRIGR
jgi:hypothetical protein